MMMGSVNSRREAIIQFIVLGKNHQRQAIKAVIDTGYTGFLTLPSAIITTLGLTWYMQEEGILGDGSLCMFNVFEATVIWDGQIKSIEINESETDPLVGMGLLDGYELNIQGFVGGLVTIKPLS
ncbi:MAG: clan AA aspartic protease [Microcystis aeruginosa Ma_QC_Ch_20071001_S25]|jgi:clan AA aspartic protease|uniref:Clan AA aspartic protease n=1 Tax=Microcystis aeruginosa Ma_QC_Ch_20071001_S25D TaxID=2486250 RepID=A0A552G729_MICAE|nr:clan AA aspartic protease [Microcystis aeruginosa K13-07]TRU44132.1 MAG: clan AA aspartic protease [Microcystis aeruginosa Ma_QC_Ch_20071001_S25]TRU54788.1 MAG: clan AA aspartic protease [Microcystis aeruginosa Ma_QC_Ch_20071001_S25D]TRU58423.1 MAG: clan AA aspartic protease [Microcystis aeruginosa Ma_QC_C_20070823_S13D]TRU61704.1 MAG: clan AA aspartic protease [Microcystis aeruginosa Ma_QC_C_20070823_S13]TRU64614.1 MAG: clan AA aspartic protease [Microcystis aeruginosa Ma_QC_Ch_20071001_M1